MKMIISALVFSCFVLSVLPGPANGLDPLAVSSMSIDPAPVYPMGYAYSPYKSKEEVALQLFSQALAVVPELKLQPTYDVYLEMYKKALQAVYSGGQGAPSAPTR